MIGYLEGKVLTRLPGQIIIKTSGVGYLVNVTPSLLLKVKEGDLVELFIHSHIREDAFDLYGFLQEEEIELFKLVMTVSGIGPKTAILVLDKSVTAVENAIKQADADFFTGIPRLGRKNAQKIIIELKNKLGSLKELDLSSESEEGKEIIDALTSMGYSKQEVLKAFKLIPENLKLEEKITFALKELGKGK
jgi:Holliday junction DNA helicase RuvA